MLFYGRYLSCFSYQCTTPKTKNVVRYPRRRDIRTTLFKTPILRDALVILQEIMTTLGHSPQLQAPSMATAIKPLSAKKNKAWQGYNSVFGTHLFRYAKATDVCDECDITYEKRYDTRLLREDVELQQLKRRKRMHSFRGLRGLP